MTCDHCLDETTKVRLITLPVFHLSSRGKGNQVRLRSGQFCEPCVRLLAAALASFFNPAAPEDFHTQAESSLQ